ncbi:MAG: DUF1284 domain-containing protein [Holosporaceae bacterium]|jgi:hypothetical protein|nr:DUF1284 domain-containing protein [Holosporaceae bacterium]
MIFLRPHHLVCLQGFRGEGYSDAFVVAVKEVVSTLNNSRHAKIITVINQCDDVCEHCPKMVNNQCEEEQEIVKLDAHFAKILKLCTGDTVSLFEIQEIARKQLLPPKICGDCRWFDICNEHWNSATTALMDE